MRNHPEETLHIKVGGYPLEFHARTAGPHGCDVGLCGHTPQHGDKLWMNSYGDIYCDPCAQRWAVK